VPHVPEKIILPPERGSCEMYDAPSASKNEGLEILFISRQYFIKISFQSAV
jgi:hypothetical protein